MLENQDHDDLAQAAVLINGVMNRHTKDIILQAMSLLCQAVQDLRVAELYMGGEPG
jgi:hypothetical protein